MSTQTGSEQTDSEQAPTSNPQLEVRNNEITGVDATFTDAAELGNSFKGRIHDKAENLRSRMSRTADWFDERFKELTFSQYCYFFAMFLLLGFALDEEANDDFLVVIGAIAGLGLIRELWIVFNNIWAHALGKALLLVLYAATANFALAISALKINSIAGVEPQIFIFTMGFTTLLMLPFWLLGASFVFLAVSIISINVWLLLSFVLRIFKIKLKIHWEDQSFAVLTMLMRIVLIPVLMIALGNLLQPYLKQMDMLDHFEEATLIEKMDPKLVDSGKFAQHSEEEIADFLQLVQASDLGNLTEKEREAIKFYNLSPGELVAINQASDQNLRRLLKRVVEENGEVPGIVFRADFSDDESSEPAPSVALPSVKPNSAEAEDNGSVTELDFEEEPDLKYLNLMVANFLYLFETYRYTACAKEPHQRGLQLDENMLFIAERDSSTELGFRFFVTTCVPNEAKR